MEAWRTEPHWFIRLDKDEEVIESLQKFATKEKITAGSIRGIGGVGPVTLAFYEIKEKDYSTKIFKGGYELLSILGNFSILNQIPYIHVHAILGNSRFQTFGGHVVRMTVALTTEIIVLPDTYQMDRTEDKGLGLNTWDGCKICEI